MLSRLDLLVLGGPEQVTLPSFQSLRTQSSLTCQVKEELATYSAPRFMPSSLLLSSHHFIKQPSPVVPERETGNMLGSRPAKLRV